MLFSIDITSFESYRNIQNGAYKKNIINNLESNILFQGKQTLRYKGTQLLFHEMKTRSSENLIKCFYLITLKYLYVYFGV